MPVKLFFRKSGGRRRNKEHLEENQIKRSADAYLVRPIRRISVSYLTGTCEQLLFARRPFFFNPCRERLRSQLINLIPFNQLSPKKVCFISLFKSVPKDFGPKAQNLKGKDLFKEMWYGYYRLSIEKLKKIGKNIRNIFGQNPSILVT